MSARAIASSGVSRPGIRALSGSVRARRRDTQAQPGVVHRVIALMRTRLSEPLSIEGIALACGTSHRTLHRAIVREHGVSPMALLRRERLTMARDELRRPMASTTVTQVALHWGFDHLGRFSRYYAREFGELPSDTLRHARDAAEAPRS